LGSAVNEAPIEFDDLGEALGPVVQASFAQAGVRLADQRADVGSARAQPAVDRAVEIGPESLIEKYSRDREHGRHRGREDQRDAQSNRQPAQRPPSFRNRYPAPRTVSRERRPNG
jgi:hypothetical protein